MEGDYDLVVVGAGPGGYVAAIRAGQLGMRTAVVERDQVGGICLNWGCIPTKALLRNAEVLSLVRRGEEFGIYCDNLRFDFSKAIDRSREVVRRLVRGVEFLLRKNKVETIKGEARLRDAHTVEVSPDGRLLKGRSVIIATGARPKTLPVLPIDGQVVITYREALELRELPRSMVVVGGGPTGIEFAYLFNAYGVRVTVVEMLSHLLPSEDEEISQLLERSLAKQGIDIMTGSQVTSLTRKDGGAVLKVASPRGEREVECQKVLVSVGVQPNSEGLGLEGLGVATQQGFIQIDERMATDIPGLYAIGDVTGKLLLAHTASAQGVAAVETIAGLETQPLDYTMIPRATYCRPQVASFGLTEREARERGLKVKVGRFPFQASGRALASGESEGMAKLVVDERSGELIGAHLIGPEVTELISELSMTRLLDGTTLELGWLIHPHPTLSEALKEAALAADGQAIHI
jgi:dihydrolipoamide dehydrogenase